MRKLIRLPEPEILQQHSARWNQQWVGLRQSNPSAAFRWYTIEGSTAREHILPSLKEQTQKHCSFCDAFPVEGVSIETIEHFRPKSTYPHLAYTWANLYYSCDACQNTKLEQWDEVLLDPDADDYSFAKYFEFDFTTGELNPNKLASNADQVRAATTIRLYGLNSRSRPRLRLNEARKWSRPSDSPSELHLWAYRDYLGID